MSSTPKDVVSDIRSQWSGISSFVQENIHNALERLSEDLYAKDSHFVLELIQNADDNTYSGNFAPKIVFQITKDGLLVLNNEKGFEEKHVRSLCSIGKTTKSKALGYIGEKGIGFKSVFKITDEPHIFSNGYRFKFVVKSESDPIGFVVPHWIDEPPHYARPKLTTFHLPLKRGVGNVLVYFDDLDPHLLLFLNKLKTIEVHNDVRKEHRLLQCEALGKNRVDLHTSVWHEDDRPQKSTRQFWVTRSEFEKPNDISEPKRTEVTTSTIVLAFPLADTGSAIGEPNNEVFAFLPIRQFGFRFIIQADFLVPANREDIHRDKPWNIWIRDAIGPTFCAALPGFKASTALQHTFYRYLPQEGEVTDSFFSPVTDSLYSQLNASDCIHTDSGRWEHPAKVLFADPTIRQLITNQELHQMISLEFAHSDINRRDIPSQLKCKRFGLDHLFQCLGHFDWVSGRPTNWFVALFSYLEEHIKTPEALASLRQLRIFPLENGALTSLSEGPIFLPAESPLRYNFASDLRILKQDIVSSAEGVANSFLTTLMKLGLLPFSALSIIDGHILPLYAGSAWKEMEPVTRRSHVVFVKDHLDAYVQEGRKKGHLDPLEGLRKTLLIRSSSQNAEGKTFYAHGPELYLPKVFSSPHHLEELFAGVEGPLFVSPDYISDIDQEHPQGEGHGAKSWTAFFTRLGVNTTPRVIPVHKSFKLRRTTHVYIDYELSPEAKAVASDDRRVEQFLRIIDTAWSGYKSKTSLSSSSQQSDSSFLAELKKLPVPTVGGARCPLGECILNSTAVHNLFGSDVPISTIALTNNEMIAALGITTQPTLSFVINQLRRLKQDSRFDFGIAHKFYTYLHQRFDEDPAQIRGAFRSEALILAGTGERAGFRCASQVCWRDLGPAIQSVRVALSPHYKELHDFFVNVDVQESPTISDLAEVLKELSEKGNPTAADLKTILAIYHDLSAHIATLDGSSNKDWLTELFSRGIFWTNKKEFWRNDGDLFLNDHQELFELFADSKSVAFLSVPHEDLPELMDLTDLAGIKSVSHAVKTSFLNAGKETLDTGWTQLLRSLLLPMARYLRIKMNKLYRKCQEEHLFESLAAIECFFVDRLTVQYSLNEEIRQSFRSSALRGSKLYISTSCAEKADTIAQELANHLGGADELANFIALLFTKAEVGSIQGLLESRHIPQLPDDENRYFEELNRAGTHTFKPVSKGILSGEPQPATTANAAAAGASSASGSPADDISTDGVETSSDSSEWIPEVAPTEAADAIVETFHPRDEVPTDESSGPNSYIISNRPQGRGPTDASTAEGDIKKTVHSYAIGHWGEEWVIWTHLKQKYASIYGESSIEQTAMGFDVHIPGGEIEVVWMNALGEQHLPYDVLIRQDNVEHFLEVKSTSTEQTEWFDVSGGQWQLAIKAGSRFSIYRVYRAGTSQPRLKIIDDVVSRWSKHELEADPVRVKL